MNEITTRRGLLALSLAGLGAIIAGLLPFRKRSKVSEPDLTHLLDQPSTEGMAGMDYAGEPKVLSSDQEFVRQWYRNEFGIDPVYNEEGHVLKFINNDLQYGPEEYEVDRIYDIITDQASSGDIGALPEAVLREMERHRTETAVRGAYPSTSVTTAATEAAEKTLH